MRYSLVAFTLGLAGAALLFSPRFAQAQIFPSAPSWKSTDNQRVGGMAFGDANGDGLLDLAAGTYSGGYPELTKNALVFLQGASGLEGTPSWVSDDIRHSTSVGWVWATGADQPDLLVVNGGASSQSTVIYPGGASGLATTAS